MMMWLVKVCTTTSVQLLVAAQACATRRNCKASAVFARFAELTPGFGSLRFERFLAQSVPPQKKIYAYDRVLHDFYVYSRVNTTNCIVSRVTSRVQTAKHDGGKDDLPPERAVITSPPRSFAHATPGGARVWKPAAAPNQGTPWAAGRQQRPPSTLAAVGEPRQQGGGVGSAATPGNIGRRRSGRAYGSDANTPASMTRRIISALDDAGSPSSLRGVRFRRRKFVFECRWLP